MGTELFSQNLLTLAVFFFSHFSTWHYYPSLSVHFMKALDPFFKQNLSVQPIVKMLRHLVQNVFMDFLGWPRRNFLQKKKIDSNWFESLIQSCSSNFVHDTAWVASIISKAGLHGVGVTCRDYVIWQGDQFSLLSYMSQLLQLVVTSLWYCV